MATHPVFRALHDVGLAAWTGGGLMGAVGLNGAVAQVDDPMQRARAGTAGWTRWAPVGGAALAGHVVGAAGLLVTDWPRVRSQRGVVASSAAKAATTGLGLGLAAWSFVLNRKMVQAGPVPVRGATEPGRDTPADVEATLRQLQLVQWANPVVGVSLIGLSAWQSEQQRAGQVAQGTVQRLLSGGSVAAPVAGVAAVAALGLLRRRRRRRSAAAHAELAPPATSAPRVDAPDQVATPAANRVVPANAAPDRTAPDHVTTPRVDTPSVESERPAVRKNVVTEPVTETVTVRHEEPVVKHEPITDANRDKALDGPELIEKEHEVVLHAEEPVVSKETVPVTQDRLAQTVREDQNELLGDRADDDAAGGR